MIRSFGYPSHLPRTIRRRIVPAGSAFACSSAPARITTAAAPHAQAYHRRSTCPSARRHLARRRSLLPVHALPVPTAAIPGDENERMDLFQKY